MIDRNPSSSIALSLDIQLIWAYATVVKHLKKLQFLFNNIMVVSGRSGAGITNKIHIDPSLTFNFYFSPMAALIMIPDQRIGAC